MKSTTRKKSAIRVVDGIMEKLCTACNEFFPLIKFYHRSDGFGKGVKAWCIECFRARQPAYKKDTQDKASYCVQCHAETNIQIYIKGAFIPYCSRCAIMFAESLSNTNRRQ